MSKPRTALALILVPLLVAGGFLWGTWNSSERLRTVEAAILNLDEAVTIDDQLIPLGRQLSAELVDGEREQNFSWVLANEESAYSGLVSGRYAALVVIPKNFSAAATSYAEEPSDAAQATIEVRTSPVAGIADGVLGPVIADAAAKALNQTLTKGYLDQIYLGFNDTGKQFVTIADGAGELADGTEALSDGLREAADGSSELADGMNLLAQGGPELTSGMAQIEDGVGEFATGLAALKTETAGLPAGTEKLADGTAAYVGGVDQLIDQASGLAQLPALVQGINQLSAASGALSGGLSSFQSGMQGLSADASSVPCPDGFTAEQCAIFRAGVQTGTGIAANSITEAVTGSQQLAGGLNQVADQVAPYGTVDPQAAAKLALLKDGGSDLVAGTRELADGMPKLAKGIRLAATGASELDDGVGEFASGLAQYTFGVSQASVGAGELASGLKDAADGSGELSDGARELADGLAEGATKVPNFDASEREQLSTVVASPIRTTELNTVASPRTAWASLLLVLALWLGALATFAVWQAVDPRLAFSSRPTGALVWTTLRPGLIVGVVQALLLAGIGAVVLGLPLAKAATITGLLLLTAITFVLVNHALVAWLGGFGRAISVLFAVVSTAAAVTYAVPDVFDAIRPFSPISPALDALRAVLTDSAAVASSVFGLVAWLVVAGSASGLSVLRARTVKLVALVPSAG
ncbi:MAG: YhgE/Pip domain-containing protein [Micropruina sp.]